MVILEIAAFFAPLWHVHQIMTEEKRRALVRADGELGPQIIRARKELEQDLDNDRRRQVVRDRLEQLTSSYRDIETMPAWPVGQTLRQRLTLGNLTLIVPLVTQVAALAGYS